MRSKAAAVLLLSALAWACRRPKPPLPRADEAPPAAALDAPAPSSATIASPLAEGPGAFTNEMQAEGLRDEAARLGIERVSRPEDEDDSEEPRPLVGEEEGLARTRAYARQFEAERHALDRDKVKNVTLPGETPGLMPARKGGAPLEPAPADDDGR